MENKHRTTGELTVIASDISIEGKIEVRHELHLFGKITGEVRCLEGSILILKEGSLVDGKIEAETLIVEGFAKGEIHATKRLWITSRGKVAGLVKTPGLQVDPGAVFDARVSI